MKSLSCLRYRSWLTAHAAQALPAEQAALLESHLNHCSECRAVLESARTFDVLLRQSSPTASAPSERLWLQLEDAIRSTELVAAPRTAPSWRWLPAAGLVAAGAAAAVLLRPVPPAPTVPVVQTATSVASPTSVTAPATPAPPPMRIVKANQPSSFEEAAQRVRQSRPNRAVRDPFRQRNEVALAPQLTRKNLPPAPQFASADHAAEIVAVSTDHVLEHARSEEQDRLIAQVQEEEQLQNPARIAPTDATTLAQNTRSLFR